MTMIYIVMCRSLDKSKKDYPVQAFRNMNDAVSFEEECLVNGEEGIFEVVPCLIEDDTNC